jgi:hypothetical protein
MQALMDRQDQRVREALGDFVLPCEPEPFWAQTTGGNFDDLGDMASEVLHQCNIASNELNGLRIVVGPDGRVVDVSARDDLPWEPPAEVIACVRDVLMGLVFPCLAGYEICPEFVIME